MSVQGSIRKEDEPPFDTFRFLLENGEEILWYAEDKPSNLNQKYRMGQVGFFLCYSILICNILFLAISWFVSIPGVIVLGIAGIAGIVGIMIGAIVIISFLFKVFRTPFKLLHQWYSVKELTYYTPAGAITASHLFVKRYLPRRRFSAQEFLAQIRDIEVWRIDAVSEVFERPFRDGVWLVFIFPGKIFAPMKIPATEEEQFKKFLRVARPDLHIKSWVRGGH